MTKCESGKVRHPDEESALRQVLVQRIENNLAGLALRSVGLGTYRCESCGSWHVGHRPGTLRMRAGKAAL